MGFGEPNDFLFSFACFLVKGCSQARLAFISCSPQSKYRELSRFRVSQLFNEETQICGGESTPTVTVVSILFSSCSARYGRKYW